MNEIASCFGWDFGSKRRRLTLQKERLTNDVRYQDRTEITLGYQRSEDAVVKGYFFWLYVNSWGRDKKEIIGSRVGVKAPARFLCTAEENSVSEIAEVTHSEADPFQDFGFVVAALNKAV